ncbi:MAG TPA: hypothetical protein VM577_17940 [Anaerovoracaceae bacterium]|nr:hypothetical protein [Anaerovoracaceae bacterium]
MSGICSKCEFCFPKGDEKFICADKYYDKDITKSIDKIKDCYSEGFEAFVENCKKEEVSFIPGFKLSQLKLDGRKLVYLIDESDKQIQIKYTKAREMMGDLEIIKKVFDETYKVKGHFDKSLFKNSNILIIR